jgi:hypothetical protein
VRLAQAASQRRKQGYSNAIMSGMAKQKEATGQITKQNRPDPSSPADAFEQFVEIVQHSSMPFDAEEDEIFRLIKPSLLIPRAMRLLFVNFWKRMPQQNLRDFLAAC